MVYSLKKISRLCSREDLLEYAKAILPDPFAFNDSGASYDKKIRELEYVSRPLWVIFSLLASGEYDESLILPYIKRIKQGLKTNSKNTFLKPTTKTRQIAVEMAVYGYGLLVCKEKLLCYFDEKEIDYLKEWLQSINDIELPLGNWYFFLLIVNYGLKANGFSYNQEKIDEAWQIIESFYLGNGWYQDGNYLQRDYYIAFTFHFYSLIFSKYVEDIDSEKLMLRSQKFAQDFIYWIDSQGRTLPFGRSLTYRFCHVSFWSAQVITDSCNDDIGIIKDLIFSNLEFWLKRDIVRNNCLSIGYGYENMVISEDYNASGSPGWAFKTFILLTLDSKHQFWQIKRQKRNILPKISVQRNPGFLIWVGKNHNYALSILQSSKPGLLQTNCKYGKFCYSTKFGWNLSRDVQGIENYGVDNTLALSIDGTEQYNSRNIIESFSIEDTYGYSRWNYGKIAVIETWLIPIDEFYHIRIHRINTKMVLKTYEGAFSIFNWNSKFKQPIYMDDYLILENQGMISGILDLFNNREICVVSQNPNTNIYNPEKNAIPCLMGKIQPGVTVYGCLIYGGFNNIKLNLSVKLKNNLVMFNDKKIYLKEF